MNPTLSLSVCSSCEFFREEMDDYAWFSRLYAHIVFVGEEVGSVSMNTGKMQPRWYTPEQTAKYTVSTS